MRTEQHPYFQPREELEKREAEEARCDRDLDLRDRFTPPCHPWVAELEEDEAA